MTIRSARNTRLTQKLYELLADGQYHDRETVVQECAALIYTDDALEYALTVDYQNARRRAKKYLPTAEWRKWIASHPDRFNYEPTAQGYDPAFGRRQIVLSLLAHGKEFHLIRENANGSGRTLVRWKKEGR